MTLIGDVGGFNGAMVLLPTYLMSYFSFIMYKLAITEEMPVKKKENAPTKSNPLQARIQENRDQTINQHDVNCLKREAKLISRPTTSWLKSLFHVGCICKHDRQMRL